MSTSLQIKVCGLTRRCDVELAAALGAGYLGFVQVPSSPRYVPIERLAELTHGLPVKRVGVFVDAGRDEILRRAEGNFDIIQLHGEESPEFAASLGLPVWKAVRVTSEADFESMERFEVEHFLLDSRNGGSGHTCDWNLAAQAARRWRIWLAGGLGPTNLRRAVEMVNPWGVDAASSLESAPGFKDEIRMRQFFKEISL